MRLNAAIGVYTSHSEAEEAGKELQKVGFEMKQISIVGKGYQANNHERTDSGYPEERGAHEQLAHSASRRSTLAPALHPVAGVVILDHVLIRVIVAWIVGGLEGAAMTRGLSGIEEALYGIGIPKDSILQYDTSLKTDKFLLVAHGTSAEVARAKEILSTTHAAETAVHYEYEPVGAGV